MNEYVGIYNETYIMNHCVKILANNIDEAHDKFVKYIEGVVKDNFYIESNMYIVGIEYLETI